MAGSALLSVSGLHAGYGEVEILRGIDLVVGAGDIVAVLGSNGTGKSTLNMTISGLVPARQGSIEFDGRCIQNADPAEIVAARCQSQAGLFDVSSAARTRDTTRRHAVGRRTADAGDRPWPDGRAKTA